MIFRIFKMNNNVKMKYRNRDIERKNGTQIE